MVQKQSYIFIFTLMKLILLSSFCFPSLAFMFWATGIKNQMVSLTSWSSMLLRIFDFVYTKNSYLPISGCYQITQQNNGTACPGFNSRKSLPHMGISHTKQLMIFYIDHSYGIDHFLLTTHLYWPLCDVERLSVLTSVVDNSCIRIIEVCWFKSHWQWPSPVVYTIKRVKYIIFLLNTSYWLLLILFTLLIRCFL